VRILGDGQWVRRHDLVDLAAVRMDEIGGDPAGSDQEFQPAPRFGSVPISAGE